MPESATAKPKPKPKYSPDFWKKLFKRYYHDEIIDLATVFTKKKGILKVEFENLKKVWAGMGETTTSGIEHLINYPDQALKDANDTLHNFSLPVDRPEGWFEKAHVEISGFTPVLAVRDLRHEHLEKFVSVRGIIIRKTEVKYKIMNAAFRCQRCDHVNHVLQTGGPLMEPWPATSSIIASK